MNLTCCPRGCPQRSVSCHNGCQTYMRYKLMRLLMNKQRMKAVKRKHERKIRREH